MDQIVRYHHGNPESPLYRGEREMLIQQIKNWAFESEDTSWFNQLTIITAEGERLNVDEYMVRYAPEPPC